MFPLCNSISFTSLFINPFALENVSALSLPLCNIGEPSFCKLIFSTPLLVPNHNRLSTFRMLLMELLIIPSLAVNCVTNESFTCKSPAPFVPSQTVLFTESKSNVFILLRKRGEYVIGETSFDSIEN